MARMIKLKSSDSVEFEVEWDAVTLSKTLTTMLETLGLDDTTATNDINIPLQIDSETLQKVIEWCNKHKGEEIAKIEDESNKEIPEWDKDFLKVDDDMLYKIIMAANYLDICHLLEYTTSKVAIDLDEMKETEKIRERYNILCDLTEEEIEKIKQENAWVSQN